MYFGGATLHLKRIITNVPVKSTIHFNIFIAKNCLRMTSLQCYDIVCCLQLVALSEYNIYQFEESYSAVSTHNPLLTENLIAEEIADIYSARVSYSSSRLCLYHVLLLSLSN